MNFAADLRESADSSLSLKMGMSQGQEGGLAPLDSNQRQAGVNHP
jgi:hypothetical protein